MSFRDLTLYVLRHGECEHNLEQRIGSHDDSPLTAKGREQAREKGRLLREMVPDLAVLDFYASPLHRACVTMELLREAAGLPASGYRADHRLMEIHAGDHIWLAWQDVPAADHASFEADPWNARRPGGESRADLFARAGRFLATLTRDAVIVTHGVTAATLRAQYLGLSPEACLSYQSPNAGVLRLSHGTETTFGA
ncbi:MAG TPA: histidine phosphatase family protein [Rhizomicrobium sp.]|jgi:probable phosphoglycerate mutase|nr:histidine phosphatase family protein [Rhizomicrobium sp.]